MSSGAIKMNRRGLTIFESVKDINGEKDVNDTPDFFERLDLMDFKDDLKYK